MATHSLTLGYWNIRGKAGVLRNLLSYCGIPFENKLYTDQNEWFGKDKGGLGFDYPNLPYIIDGDKKMTETNSLIYYIPIKAGKRELIGNTDDKFIQVHVALNVVQDLRNSISRFVWTKGDFKADKEEAFTKGDVKSKLEILNKNLEGKEWVCGFLSIADFALFEAVDLVHDLEATRLEPYPNLVSFRNRFLELPEVKAHRQSPSFIKTWFPSFAAWTNE